MLDAGACARHAAATTLLPPLAALLPWFRHTPLPRARRHASLSPAPLPRSPAPWPTLLRPRHRANRVRRSPRAASPCPLAPPSSTTSSRPSPERSPALELPLTPSPPTPAAEIAIVAPLSSGLPRARFDACCDRREPCSVLPLSVTSPMHRMHHTTLTRTRCRRARRRRDSGHPPATPPRLTHSPHSQEPVAPLHAPRRAP